MAATKKVLEMAYDAGQAAQLHGVPDDACPFSERDPDRAEERAAYFDGKNAELADKWKAGGGNALSVEVTE